MSVEQVLCKTVSTFSVFVVLKHNTAATANRLMAGAIANQRGPRLTGDHRLVSTGRERGTNTHVARNSQLGLSQAYQT